MATITSGHDTQGTTATVKRVVKKQPPMWVILVSALTAPIVLAGGMKLVTSLEDMSGSIRGSASIPYVTETRWERENREHREAWQDVLGALDELGY